MSFINRIPKKAIERIAKWKVLRGDTVQVLAGKDKGRVGTIVSVNRRLNTVIVEGLNLVTKNIKASSRNPGARIQTESPLHVSNVATLDPSTGFPARIGFRYLEDGSKVRVSKGTGTIIPRPEVLTARKHARTDGTLGSKDTPLQVAERSTYVGPGTSEGTISKVSS